MVVEIKGAEPQKSYTERELKQMTGLDARGRRRLFERHERALAKRQEEVRKELPFAGRETLDIVFDY